MTAAVETGALPYVVLDSDPYVYRGGDPDDAWDLRDDLAGLTEDLAAAISALSADFDAAACTQCDNGSVGWGLVEDDDGRAGSRFYFTTLIIRPGGSAARLCEDCTIGLLDEPPAAG